MECVPVKLARERRVKIDDDVNGRTGDLIEVEAGSHVVSLGPPANFTPGEQRINLKDTSELQPREICFELDE